MARVGHGTVAGDIGGTGVSSIGRVAGLPAGGGGRNGPVVAAAGGAEPGGKNPCWTAQIFHRPTPSRRCWASAQNR